MPYHPNDCYVHVHAMSFFRWGKMSEATQAYKKVLKLSPNHTKAKAGKTHFE